MSYPVYKPSNASIRKIWDELHPEDGSSAPPPPSGQQQYQQPPRSGSSSSATSAHRQQQHTQNDTAQSARKNSSGQQRNSVASGSRSAPTGTLPQSRKNSGQLNLEGIQQSNGERGGPQTERLPAIRTQRLAPAAAAQQRLSSRAGGGGSHTNNSSVAPMPQIRTRQSNATQSGSFSTSSPPPSTTTSFEQLSQQQQQQKARPDDRPVYVVVCLPGIGGVFEGIRSYLLHHRRNWVDGNCLNSTFTSDGDTGASSGAGKKRQAAAGQSASSSTRPPPCCNKLSRVSLFMGDKKTTEQLSEDARLLAMRARRQSSALAPAASLNCRHAKRASLMNLPLPTSPDCLLNFIEGLKAITLKSRMVKTLLTHHRNSWKELGTYLPKTYQLIPTGPGVPINDEREQMVDAICEANVEVFDACREIASYWVAKSSHGSHGDNIQIFFGDQEGLDKLIKFIDNQKDPYAWVVSRYIDRPLLYNKRKFDIRVWVLVLPSFEVFVYRQLVMRTSSEKYDRSNCTTDNAKGLLSNITNHCVQAESAQYGKHEQGNELWRDSLDTLVQQHAKQLLQRRQKKQMQQQQQQKDLARQDSGIVLSPNAQAGLSSSTLPTLDNCVMPQIRRIIAHSFRAVKSHVPDTSFGGSTALNFQMLGYDFIIDERLNVWLLEINGSPGVADALMPKIVEDTVEMVLDKRFPDQGTQRVGGGSNEYEKLGNF